MLKYLDNTGLAYLWNKIKALVPGLSKKTQSIPFGQVDSTSTSTVFTATIDGIDELRDGVCCYLRNGVVTSEEGWTLNINNLGAKPVYSTLSSEDRIETLFNVAYTMLFVYNSSRVSGGCWDLFYGYNSNTTYDLNINYVSIGRITTANYPIVQYSLCAFDINGKLSAFTTTATTSTGKSLVPTAFPIGAKIYASNSSYSKNTSYNNITTLRTTCRDFDIRYSSVRHNVAIFPNSTFSRIYMVVNVDQENNAFTLSTQTSNGYVNNFTNQNSLIEGNFYIEIGFNSGASTSYYYSLLENNPLYYYDGTQLISYNTYKENALNTALSNYATTQDLQSYTPTSQLASVATSGDYADLTNTPTIPSISNNISTDKTSTAKTTSPKAVYDEIHPEISNTEPSGGMIPNVVYNFGELSGNTTFTLAAPTDNSIVNHYYFCFDTPNTAPMITWPSGLTWYGGSDPTISASKHYEISVINNIACYLEV